jgi:hypothetical protein
MDQDYGGLCSAFACSVYSPSFSQVVFLLFVDTLNTIFDVGLLWRYTITLFGELRALMVRIQAELFDLIGNYQDIEYSHWCE